MDDKQRFDTLGLLTELRVCLRESTGQQAQDCWSIVQKIEASLAADPRFSAAEKVEVQRLKAGVRDIIVSMRRGLTPHRGLAIVPLLALESSLCQRTMGEDDRVWPE